MLHGLRVTWARPPRLKAKCALPAKLLVFPVCTRDGNNSDHDSVPVEVPGEDKPWGFWDWVGCLLA